MNPVETKSRMQQLREVEQASWCLPQQSAGFRRLFHPARGLAQFADSWNHLPIDPYLRDSGSYRYRRYAVLEQRGEGWQRLPPEAHFQTSRYNNLHGGFYRHYASITRPVLNSALFQGLLDWNLQLLKLRGLPWWRVQAHQFRITADAQSIGKPTPEGLHHDGADFVFIMLLERNNVGGGKTSLSRDGQIIHELTMEQPGEALLLDDRKLKHSVSPVVPKNKAHPAVRDVLVLTFHQLEGKSAPYRTDRSATFRKTLRS